MWTIIKKESLGNILTLRFVIGFFACNLIFSISTFALLQDFIYRSSQAKAAIAENGEQIKKWTVYSEVRPTAVVTPSPLSIFSSGQGNRWGNKFSISHTQIPVFAVNEEGDASLISVSSFLNFPEIAQLFLSLLAILFTFDSVCREKEMGLLRLILTNPVSRSQLISAKFVGAVIAMIPIIATSFLSSLLIRQTFLDIPFSMNEIVRYILILLMLILYCALFAAVGLLTSTLAKSTSSSLIVCLFVWVLITVIIPMTFSFSFSKYGLEDDADQMTNELAALVRIAQSWSNKSIVAGMMSDDYYIAYPAFYSNGTIRIAAAGPKAIEHYEEIVPQWINEQEERATKRFSIENTFLQRRLEKNSLAKFFSIFSPSTAFSDSIDDLTDSNTANYLHLLSQVRNYRNEIKNYIKGKGGWGTKRWFCNSPEDAEYNALERKLEDMTRAERLAYYKTKEYKSASEKIFSNLRDDPRRILNLKDLPVFEPETRSLEEVITDLFGDVLILILYTALYLVLAFTLFLNYDVR